jgi:4'-phosphopantetheinyl transferase
MGPVPWQAVREIPKLVEGAVHVWWAAPSDASPWMYELLGEAERNRHSRYRRPVDQDRFLVGNTLLKRAAAAQLDIDARTVTLVRICPDCDEPHGKPTLPRSGLELSLAHSGDRIVVATALRTPVGIDVERETATIDADGLAGTVLTAREAATLAALPASQRRAGFLAYWTRKEAVLKATGDGLRMPLRQVEVTGPVEPPRVLALLGRSPEQISLLGLDAGPDHAAALAVIGPAPEHVLQLDASTLLHER